MGITSLEHSPPTEGSVEAPARLTRLPRTRVATSDSRSRMRARVETMAATRAAKIFAFGVLLALSLFYKARGLSSAYWIDEGLSVGIGSHPLLHIPGLLQQDGSPPLYYMMLHVWMQLVGTSEFATQSLSTIFGLLCVPVAFWFGNQMMSKRVAWAAAAMAAVNPFLTLHAYEARMYALMILLGMITSGAFVLAFVQGRKRWRYAFGVGLALMLYTHNWALFFGAASVVAFGWLWWKSDHAERPKLLRDGLWAYGITAVLYLPWVPTLIEQVQHTGAPWSVRPMFDELIFGTGVTIGGRGPSVALALCAGIAISGFVARGKLRELRTTQTLLILFAGAVLFAFVASQLSPAWASRYLAVALGPLILFSACILVNAQRIGMWGLAIFLVLCALPQPVHLLQPSDEKAVAEIVKPAMRPGDLVISTHPERVPIMRYYLGPQFRYGDLYGFVKDPQIMDWRDAMQRMKTVTIKSKLDPMLNTVPVGGHVMLVRPLVDNKSNSWKAPWTHRVNIFSRHWSHALNADPRFRPVASAPNPYAQQRDGVRAVVFVRVR